MPLSARNSRMNQHALNDLAAGHECPAYSSERSRFVVATLHSHVTLSTATPLGGAYPWKDTSIEDTCHLERASAAERVERSPDGVRVDPTLCVTMMVGRTSKPTGDPQLATPAQNDMCLGVGTHWPSGSNVIDKKAPPRRSRRAMGTTCRWFELAGRTLAFGATARSTGDCG